MNKLSQNEEPLLSDADIQEFIQIYEEEFGEPISPKDAREMADRLIELYRVLYATPSSAPSVQDPRTSERIRPLKTPTKQVFDIKKIRKNKG